MKTTIYLIRHGQTVWNVERRMQGRQDSPLTPQGITAAERLVGELPPIDAVYSSPSGRTMQTARILFGDREIVKDERLREIDLGNWEGCLQSDLDQIDREQHFNFWKAPHRYRREGLETFQHVASRAEFCLRKLSERHAGESIALVSHTTVIRSMLFSVEPRCMADFWLPPAVYPASLSEIEINDGIAKIVRFGCTAHHETQLNGAY